MHRNWGNRQNWSEDVHKFKKYVDKYELYPQNNKILPVDRLNVVDIYIDTLQSATWKNMAVSFFFSKYLNIEQIRCKIKTVIRVNSGLFSIYKMRSILNFNDYDLLFGIEFTHQNGTDQYSVYYRPNQNLQRILSPCKLSFQGCSVTFEILFWKGYFLIDH